MEAGFEKMDEIKCAVESISDALVYGSLVKQGCSNTALKFLKERNRKEFLDLKSITLEDVIKDRKCWIQNHTKSAVVSISDTLVYNHLEKLGCTNTAKRILTIRNQPEFLKLRGIPRLEYLINDYKGTITKTEVDSVVGSISDALVYNSLQNKRCMKTAKRLLKIRRQTKFLDVKGIRLQDLINDQIYKPAKISSSIVLVNGSDMNLVKELPETESVKRVNGEAITATLVRETNYFQEYLLPYGWKKVGYKRKSGSSQNVWDFYAISPDGKRLRSSNEVNKYLDNNPGVKCDLNVTNTKRPTKLSENRKSYAKMAKYSTSYLNHSNLTFETEPQPQIINNKNYAEELMSENQENRQSSTNLTFETEIQLQISTNDKKDAVYLPSKYHENYESVINDSNSEIEDWEGFIQEHYGEKKGQNQPEIKEMDVAVRHASEKCSKIVNLINSNEIKMMKKAIASEITDTVDARKDSYANKEEKSVLIKDVFKDRLEDILAFRDTGTEVVKVLTYIFYSNTKVMKTQAATANVKFKYHRELLNG